MEWINRSLYPFTSKYADVDGHRLHYVDEGSGKTILFVHGTPEWSFGYRDLIKGLSPGYRCIAMDHLGFGISDKPPDVDYSVSQQAERLVKFIQKLNLKDIHLVANDFGGSIALNYAIQFPENVNRICLFNTWMWALNEDPHFAKPGRVIHTWFGKFLYRQLNFSVRVMLPSAFGDKTKLTKEIFRHYLKPFSKASYRNGVYAFAKDILDAGPWWDKLWQNLNRIQDKPFLICWGMKDKLILPRELKKWEARLPHAKVIRFENTGHFVQEEEPEEMVRHLKTFFDS